MNKGNDTYSQRLLHRRYLEGKMTPDERNDYEKMLQRDPFAADAAEGFTSLKGEELDSDLNVLEKRLADRISSGRSRRITGYAVAAATIFIISTFIILREVRRPELLISDNSLSGKNMVDTIVETEPIVEVISKVDDIKETSKKEVVSSDKKSIQNSVVIEKDSQLSVMEAEYEVKLAEEVSVPVIDIAVPSASKKEMEPLRAKGAVAPVISGQVVSSVDGEPIPGVTIALQGKVAGVATDINGRFSIIADSSSIITARFIGMRSVEVPAGQAGREKIVMDPDIMGLDEVVVVAAGTERRKEVSSSGTVTVIDMTKNDNISDYTPAMPVGGYAAFREYVAQNSRYPEVSSSQDREVVRLKFTVTQWGEITGIEVVRSPGKLFSDEAVRLLKSGPAWVPPSRDGIPLSGSVSVRIVLEKK